MYEQICNGKNPVLQTCGNTKKQYCFTGLRVKTELTQGYPAFVFSPKEVDHYQRCGDIQCDRAGSCHTCGGHMTDDNEKQVQKNVDRSGNGKIDQRSLRIAAGT